MTDRLTEITWNSRTARSTLPPALAILVALVLAAAGCSVAGGTEAPEAEQTAEAAAATTVTVAAAGDIACPPGKARTARSCAQGATARLIRGLNPRKVIALGDEQYEQGTRYQFRRSYDRSWGTFKGRTVPVVGNHEYLTPRAAGYYGYFGRRAPGYYTTTIGAWRLFVLNSNCRKINCDREENWLRNGLSAHPARCTMIAMHHARYSSGREHGSNPGMARFWKIADNHRADLVLAGHDHDYERFAPMDAWGHRRSDGMMSFVVGTGGRDLYHLGTRAPGSQYFRGDKFGVLLLSLSGTSFSWRFRTIDGGVRDAGTHTCR